MTALAKKQRVANDYEVAVEELDRAVEAITVARDYLFSEIDVPGKIRALIDRWSYTRGLTNAEKALLEELVSELEAGR
jgi:hypothetical protein